MGRHALSPSPTAPCAPHTPTVKEMRSTTASPLFRVNAGLSSSRRAQGHGSASLTGPRSTAHWRRDSRSQPPTLASWGRALRPRPVAWRHRLARAVPGDLGNGGDPDLRDRNPPHRARGRRVSGGDDRAVARTALRIALAGKALPVVSTRRPCRVLTGALGRLAVRLHDRHVAWPQCAFPRGLVAAVAGRLRRVRGGAGCVPHPLPPRAPEDAGAIQRWADGGRGQP